MNMRGDPKAEEAKRQAQIELTQRYYWENLTDQEKLHRWKRRGIEEADKKAAKDAEIDMSSRYLPGKLKPGVYTVEGVEIDVRLPGGLTRKEPLQFLVDKDESGNLKIQAMQVPADDEARKIQGREMGRGYAIHGGTNRIKFGFNGLRAKEMTLKHLQQVEKMLDQAIKDGVAIRLDGEIMKRLGMSPRSLIHENPFSLRTLKAAFGGDSEAAIIQRILQKQDLSQKKVRENKQLQNLKGKVEANAKYEKNKETLEKDVQLVEKARTDLENVVKNKGSADQIMSGIKALNQAIDKVNEDFKEINTEVNSTNSQNLDKELLEKYKGSVEKAKKTIDDAKISDVLKSDGMNAIAKEKPEIKTELESTEKSLKELGDSSDKLVTKLDSEADPVKRAEVLVKELEQKIAALDEKLKEVEEKPTAENLKDLDLLIKQVNNGTEMIKDEINRKDIPYDALAVYGTAFDDPKIWDNVDKMNERVKALESGPHKEMLTKEDTTKPESKDLVQAFKEAKDSSQKLNDNIESMSIEVENAKVTKKEETISRKPK